MGLLTVIALYDKDLKFFPDGKQFTIPTDSAILGTKVLPTERKVPGTTEYVATAPLLTIKTIEFGDLYLNMTLSQYFAAIIATYASIGAPEMPLTLDVPDDTPEGDTITSALLYNSSLDAIAVNGVWVKGASLENVGTDGVITLVDALADGDWVAILYHKN